MTLERGLQRFAKPWYRVRALRVFRDEASLAASPHLWSSIAQSLDSSRFFVLLASTAAAASPWVAREVERWRASKPVENFLLGLTDGEVVWSERERDFDWQRTTALPQTLCGAFTEEPRWVDLRWARGTDELSLSHPAFRDAVADLAAPMRGMDKDELASEEVRQHRRTMRVVWTAVAALATLTGLALLFGVLAVRRGNEAQRQLRLAQSRQLAAQANLDRAGEGFDRGLLLALTATELQPTAEARDALVRGLEATSRLRRLLPGVGGTVPQLSFSRDGRALEVLRSDGAIVTLRGSARHVVSRPFPNDDARGGPVSAAVSNHWRMVSSASQSGSVVGHERPDGRGRENGLLVVRRRSIPVVVRV